MRAIHHGPRVAQGLVSALLALLVLAPAWAAAATLTVAPGAVGQAEPCTVATPCEFAWGVEHARSGDTVQFESGLYELDGSVHEDGLTVNEGVTIEGVTAGPERPVIRQTAPFPSCRCASVSLGAGARIVDMQVEQIAVGITGTGALGMSPDAAVERTILVGGGDGLSTFEGELGEMAGPGISDSLIVADRGTAIQDENVEHLALDNDTLVGHLGGGSVGIALDLHATSLPTRVQATNTIFRGITADIEADGAGAEAQATLHYSDARPSMELATGEKSTIEDTDHPQHGEPVFFSETDFEVKVGSPTIGAGTTDPRSGEFDLAGKPRSFAGLTDIGAFQVEQAAPVPVTGGASTVGRESALLAGTVDPRGAATSWRYEYGTTTAYGQLTAPEPLGPEVGAHAVTVQLSGLAPARTYHFRLVASNSSGASAGADETFTTNSLPPVLTGLRLSPPRFRAARRGPSAVPAKARGTLVSYSDSEAATTTFRVLARRAGVRSGRNCVAPPRRRARGRRYTACSRFVSRGTFTHADGVGVERLRFTGTLGGHPLPPGSYRLELVALSAARLSSAAISAPFTILG